MLCSTRSADVLNGDEHPVALEDVITMTPLPFSATILGAPRIGPNRELKRATEKYWAGSATRADLEAVASGLRQTSLAELAAAGLDSIPVNTFSYYDHVLDTAVMLGALPPRVATIEDDLDRYFAAARGTKTITPAGCDRPSLSDCLIISNERHPMALTAQVCVRAP